MRIDPNLSVERSHTMKRLIVFSTIFLMLLIATNIHAKGMPAVAVALEMDRTDAALEE